METNIEHATNDQSESKTGSDKTHLSVVERYYKPKYILDCQANEDEDLCILTHSNRICIITLAPSHPVVRDKKTIKQISFKVGGVDRLNNKVSGKGKRGAQELNAGSPICKIACVDGEEFTVYSGIKGQLIEVNECLIQNPELILKKPLTEGYIAIVLPKLKDHEQVLKKLKTEEEYKQRRVDFSGAGGS
ncbi:protein Abitram-like isoform X1 [Mytilus californianus]|uniref:protein Abitram-like isoform X1 n=1 Tax=Mytilus californianus TaxID=6549 RepID=UPI0022462D2C|nr:protein Abitram-like isoform X1 [Mytilus californianus]